MVKSKFNFTFAEKRILNLLSEGLNSKEIADYLGNNINTIKAHKRNLYLRTHTNDTVKLLLKSGYLKRGIKNGITHPSTL